METVKVTWEGVTPLVVQRPIKGDSEKVGIKAKPKAIPPEEMLYATKEGRYYFPFLNIYGCLRDGAARVIERNRQTYKDLLLGMVRIEQQRILLPTEYKWEPWGRFLKKGNGESIWVESPMFPKWHLDFDIGVNTALIQTDSVKQIMEQAGSIFGFGSCRAVGFGRFNVTRFE